MTQIQSEHSNNNNNNNENDNNNNNLNNNNHHIQLNSIRNNQPTELNSIYQSLIKLVQSFPTQPNNNHTKSLSIPSPLNFIALTCHAFLISNSFRLNLSSTQQSHSNQDPSLATDWHSILAPNQHSLQFTYSHLQSTLSFEFTFSKIGNRISINAITVQDDRLFTWILSIPEYLDSSHFPILLHEEQEINSNGFRSSTHLLDFISHFVNEILNQLLPDLFPTITSINKSSTAITRSSTNESSHASTGNPQSSQPPLFPSHLPTPTQQPNPTPLEIGRSDLEPIGTSNLQIPSLYNHIPRGDLDQQSGMIVHPRHPIFNPPPQFGQPELFHPPGARFDPIGPNSSSHAFSRPRPNPAFDLDPMGGLGQGLPVPNPHLGFHSNRPDFNEFRPPGGSGSGYDDMFM